MRKGLTALGVIALAAFAFGQTRVYYINGVPYVWPSTQGLADKLLRNDGSGTLTWATPPSPEGLWASSVVLSTVACPSGWTIVSTSEERVLRGAATSGSIGGGATHSHASATGVVASTGFSVTGNTSQSTIPISGTTDTASVSHGHTTTLGTTGVGGSPPAGAGLTSVTALSSNPSHSHSSGSYNGNNHFHASGTFAASSHGHGPGAVATDAVAHLSAYYNLVVCEKDE